MVQARLARDVTEAGAIHQALTDRLQQALVAEASIGSVIRVVDAAKPPATPARRRLLGLVFGGIFGLVLGVGGAFIKEQAEDPIKSAEHGERVLSLRVLAAIPEISPELAGTPGAGPGLRAPSLWESLRAGRWSSAGFLETARHRRSVFAESFRRLRTNLLYLRKQPPRTLLVTSPGSDEGTEIVAANLAVALAHAGLRVWLVECDLMNPALDRAPPLQSASGRGARAGLADLLGKGIAEQQVIRRTTVENLWFIPAGTPPATPTELLGSRRMRAFLTQDRDDVDIVVLAAAPTVPVTDAAVLAPAVEGVLLVARIGTTSVESAQLARRHIEAVGAQVLGVVLTGATIAGPGTRPGRSAETGASPAPESPETGASTAPMSVRGGARLPLLTGTLATLLAAGAGITVGLLLR